MFGDVWEWTRSPYSPYPGYKPASDALGEYKRCSHVQPDRSWCRRRPRVTPRSHIRATYRNFFGPEARWQFTGIRLARDSG